MTHLLDVHDLRVSFPTADGLVQAVRGVSFAIDSGKTLGIVGESGSGKTVLTQTLLGLTPGGNVSGRALFRETDLLAMTESQLRDIRGAQISVIFQDPLTSLHPMYRVGKQITEMLRAHDKSLSRAQAFERAVELLARVGIPQPRQRARDYPHQFSGGMRQRVMIAMAMSLEPKLIIADEPTTALDATVQAQIMDLLLRLQAESGTALIVITHDLGVVADIADDVLVMYAGRAVEMAAKRDIFYEPHHPYAKALLESRPSSPEADGRLRPISGQPPSLVRLPSGCPFHPRCKDVMDRCRSEEPVLVQLPGTSVHRSACWLPASPDPVEAAAPQETVRPTPVTKPSKPHVELQPPAEDELLRVENLVKNFPVRGTALLPGGSDQVHAVNGVSFTLRRGQTLGLVGETGCGKSTLARCIAGLIPVSSGTVTFEGRDITNLSRHQMQPLRREIQIIFQDPYGSLNPRRRVGSIIGEPFLVHKTATGAERKRSVQDLMDRVGLNPEHYNRFPAEFSGGQRQRIGLARALALRPKLIICDEPVSALDVSIQAQILNLLADLQQEFGLSYLFIAHDLEVVRHVSNQVMVMYLGKVAESGAAAGVFDTPRHPYTSALLSAAPAADPDAAAARQRIILAGDVPSPVNPPDGCLFHPRCPVAQDVCRGDEPVLEPQPGDADGSQHLTACHFPGSIDEHQRD